MTAIIKNITRYVPELIGATLTTVGVIILLVAKSELLPLLILGAVCLGWWIVCRACIFRGQTRERELLSQMSQGLHGLSVEAEGVFTKLASETGEQLSNLAKETEQVRQLLDSAIEQIMSSFQGLEENARNQGQLVLDLTGSQSVAEESKEINFEKFLSGVKGVLNELVMSSTKNGQKAGLLAQRMNQTSSGFQDVAKLIKEVKKIADQTNLLAINASVEAARAGNQGKGFAVVASEVRQLSVHANRFSEEIAAAVEGIEHAIAEIESAIDEMATSELTLVRQSQQQADDLLHKSQAFNCRVEESVSEISGLAQKSTRDVATAVTSLQFHDMVSQIMVHADKRIELLNNMLGNLGQVSLLGHPEAEISQKHSDVFYMNSLKKGLEEASELIETVRHNPVSQKSMDEGEIELF